MFLPVTLWKSDLEYNGAPPDLVNGGPERGHGVSAHVDCLLHGPLAAEHDWLALLWN